MILSFVLLSAAGISVQAAEQPQMVFSGVILDQGDDHALEKFTDWLSEKSGYSLRPHYVESYQALSESLRISSANLAWTCGQPFVEDHTADGQQLVAVPLYKGKPFYYSLVIARKGGSEKALKDFAGKVAAYSDVRSNSGMLAPRYVLHTQGIDMEEHFRLLLHTGRHENSIEAVAAGLADVASVDEYIWDEYLKTHPDMVDRLVVIQRNGPYPFTPIVAGATVPEAAVKKIRRALVGMHQDVKGAIILRRLGLDGFVEKPVSFYAPIAAMLEAVR